MNGLEIRGMKERDYRMIPVSQINVVNSRQRERTQFLENVRSINDVGLYKPILVNSRNLGTTGLYDLICGEGRLLAHIELGRTHIAADVWDIDERQAHLMTLGENIARTPPQTIEFARAQGDARPRHELAGALGDHRQDPGVRAELRAPGGAGRGAADQGRRRRRLLAQLRDVRGAEQQPFDPAPADGCVRQRHRDDYQPATRAADHRGPPGEGEGARVTQSRIALYGRQAQARHPQDHPREGGVRVRSRAARKPPHAHPGRNAAAAPRRRVRGTPQGCRPRRWPPVEG
ncbi:MAG: ParB N-terminal domain-containing protein [Phycisphaerales bacterium]|nr:ParB N-terminal domain-containing protein [Phycisphaerales bacterium]